MKNYHLFWNNETAEPYAVKSGFSWLALSFTFFYPLYLKQWKTALIYFLGWLSITLLSEFIGLGDNMRMALGLVYSLYVAVDYSECVFGEYMKRPSFTYLGNEFASGHEHALFQAFKKYLDKDGRLTTHD